MKVLKQKNKEKFLQSSVSKHEIEKNEHINLFEDIDNAIKTTNKEHDQDVKNKQEEYEKKIGYLTYLGQDTNESTGLKNWYEVLPSSRHAKANEIKDTYDKLLLKDEDGKPKKKIIDEKDGEISWKAKQYHDPINSFKQYCHKIEKKNTEVNCKKPKNDVFNNTKIKHKKHDKKSINEKQTKLLKLREARLKREQLEKYKTELFLGNLNGSSTSSNCTEKKIGKIKPKYNSQFNPELARQNYR